MENTEVTFLPKPFRVSHLPRKEMLGPNWQLKEDPTPFFVKYGYIWHFTGFGIPDRINLMKQTWDLFGDKYK